MRIPLEVYNRVTTELQLPESQRRKIKFASMSQTPHYVKRTPDINGTWVRPFSPPKCPKTPDYNNGDALKMKIKQQLRDSHHLLENIDITSQTTTTATEEVTQDESVDEGFVSRIDLLEDDYPSMSEEMTVEDGESSIVGKAEVIPLTSMLYNIFPQSTCDKTNDSLRQSCTHTLYACFAL